MTPLQIEILLHYYGRPNDYRNGNFSSPAVWDAIEWFKRDELLARTEACDAVDAALSSVYAITERGRVYVEALLSVPLPEKRWVMPDRWVDDEIRRVRGREHAPVVSMKIPGVG